MNIMTLMFLSIGTMKLPWFLLGPMRAGVFTDLEKRIFSSPPYPWRNAEALRDPRPWSCWACMFNARASPRRVFLLFSVFLSFGGEGARGELKQIQFRYGNKAPMEIRGRRGCLGYIYIYTYIFMIRYLPLPSEDLADQYEGPHRNHDDPKWFEPGTTYRSMTFTLVEAFAVNQHVDVITFSELEERIIISGHCWTPFLAKGTNVYSFREVVRSNGCGSKPRCPPTPYVPFEN